MVRYDTTLERGYFMSQEQRDAVVGRLVRERSEAYKQLALLQAEARELSKLFTGLGAMVQPDKLWNIALESYEPHLSKDAHDKIAKLKTDVQETQQKLATLNDELKKFDVQPL
jgi:flagellar biosynthesis chaperone FliJ